MSGICFALILFCCRHGSAFDLDVVEVVSFDGRHCACYLIL
jgi:hypothetical protein